MALNINDTKFFELAEIICEEGLSGLDKAVQIIINQAMLIEVVSVKIMYEFIMSMIKY
jgi:hypothetical protein